MTIREKLIAAGVKNLVGMGYVGCNKNNILTDKNVKFFSSLR
jgi:hypothetical protein